MTSPSSGTARGPSGMFAFFGNMKLTAKIMTGFGCVLVMLLIVGAGAFVAFQGVSDKFGIFTQRVDVAALVAEVDRDVIKLRRFVREFAISGDEKQAEAARELGKELSAKVTEGLETIKNPERLAKMTELAEDYAAYIKGFDTVVTLKLEEDKLVEERLDPLGSGLTAEIEALIVEAAKDGNSNAVILAQAALQNLMQVRLNAGKFIGRGIEEAYVKAEEHFVQLEKAIEGLDKATKDRPYRAAFDKISAEDQEYFTAFERVAEISHELEKLVNGEMKAAGEAMAEAADAIETSAVADQKTVEEETTALVGTMSLVILGIVAAGLTIGAALAWFIGRGISAPIQAMTGSMRVLAGGDSSVVIGGRERRDEIGTMANAVQVFKDNMIEAARLRDEQQGEQQRQLERAKRMEAAISTFDKAIGEVVGAVSSSSSELQSTAQSLSSTAEETSRQSNAVAAASEQMTQNVQTVASATEELSASIREIGNQVTESTRIVGDAVTQAEDTNSKVKSLSEAAQKIGEVVTLINDIASQTNLLALNATIEAARAGEAGKGFAVVASEVKNLATQTAKATEEIAGQVRAIQESTESSAHAIGSITQTINRVSEIATAIASAVEEQGAATQEIARNVQEAASGTTEVSSNIAGVTQASQQTGAAASEVLASAGELAKNSTMLKDQVERFLREVRAA